MGQIPTLTETVGHNLRSLRTTEGLSQEDVAAVVRQIGLGWTRTTVNQVERGIRRLNLDEVVILCEALEIRLDDLLAGDGEVAVVRHVSPEVARKALEPVDTTASLADVRRALATRRPTGGIKAPSAGMAYAIEALRKSKRPLQSRLAQWRRWWPDLDEEWILDEIAEPAASLAEQVAAKKLSNVLKSDNLDSLDVAVAAFGLWGEPLTARRDHLAGPDSTQAARGHVTRGLLDELAAHMKETKRGKH